ncbi:hypothetical protein BKA65DRAFT_207952 [Rhexocercosporidium sp. MPI-PUGE-AT-0058]|nr:hypothetical protein BKA65DRAFT_207952 [Rhexocercosporidium sp. MPI-PUGE-AT-0058]
MGKPKVKHPCPQTCSSFRAVPVWMGSKYAIGRRALGRLGWRLLLLAGVWCQKITRYLLLVRVVGQGKKDADVGQLMVTCQTSRLQSPTCPVLALLSAGSARCVPTSTTPAPLGLAFPGLLLVFSLQLSPELTE